MTDKKPITQTIIGKEFPEKVIPLIKQARDIINIVVYSWWWYPDQIGSGIQKFNNALVDAAKKGVNIKVLTNEHPTIAILKKNGIKARKLESERKLHAKLMIIDNKTAIVGSHNYTMGAFTTNYEISIITQDEEVVNRLKQFFNNLWPF